MKIPAFPVPLLLVVLLSLLLHLPAHAQAGQSDADNIRAVAQAFRQAIVDKDETAFMALFLDERTTWLSVASEARLAAARSAGLPAPRRVRTDPDRTPLSFIRGIVESDGPHDEVFSDMRISSDGDIASLYFDFTYLFNGRPINAGREAWLLVRTEDGWRIVSVIWSNS